MLQARDAFLASRRGIREKTRSHYESATQRLLRPDPNKLVHRITVSDLESILKNYENPNSYRTYRRCVSTFFRWAVQKRMCAENPCERLDLPPPVSSHLQILSLRVTTLLLRAAMLYRKGETVPSIAIALFGGLRPSELENLRPEDVKHDRIRVTGGKMRRTLKRSVPIPPNLAAWLKAYPFKGLPKNFYGKFRTLRKAIGETTWVADVFRHTSISFQLERDKNEALTAYNNGTSAKMIEFHYRDLVDNPSEVVAYWTLSPGVVAQALTSIQLPKSSTVEWPGNAVLAKWVQSTSLSKIGAELGVSDVAVRKRCLKQKIILPSRHA
ncbi:site-specific integrase [Luteolibacter ambystomatis]|uniref:Site-specific integrase n=1 Tax=Luteolibacter ambystomatis TaxID=2824561 RepID=A0A975J251_9BACT|nr:site-specific integrase [Luteolibacter ambystomatis]QUE52650.1 site-specific integrase [Luteolibacter ambystomatis]